MCMCKALSIRLVSSDSKFDSLGQGCSSVMEHLPSVCEVPGSVPSIGTVGVKPTAFTRPEKSHVLTSS